MKLFFIILLAFSFLHAPSVFAAEKKAKPSASPSATPDDRVAFHGAIVSLSKAGRTFTLKGKKGPAIYAVSDTTKMMKGTAAATVDDLAPGVYVRGAARRASDGRLEALTVKIEPNAK